MFEEKWITYLDEKTDVPLFKKEFRLPTFVKKAVLKITSLGFYYPILNYDNVTENLFMPGWTDYTKRVQEQTFEVTKLLKRGKNFIAIFLAKGWASSDLFGWSKHPYSPYPLLKARLDIELENGERIQILTDETWDVYSSYILYSDIYNGEIWDLNKKEEYLGKALTKECHIPVISQEGEDVIKGETIFPRKMFQDSKGDWIVDFGQNFAGNIEIDIISKGNEKISFVPAEILDKDGNFYNENYRKAKSFFSYSLRKGINHIFPLFSFEGLRYIKLIDMPSRFHVGSLKGRMIHSALKRTCYFDSGNEKINQLYHNIIYGQLSNYIDVPTDCPQRDERLGWLGDAQVFARTACINFNCHNFFKKWLHDLSLDQKEDGSLEGVCPIIPGHEVEISSGWADAATILPYEVYMAYGDKELLRDNFSMMKKWVDYVKNTGENPYLFDSGFHFGDWLGMDSPYQSLFGATNIYLVASAFYAYSVSLLIKAGKELEEDVTEYESLYENILKEFQNAYLKDGLPTGKKALEASCPEKSTNFTQAAISLILYFHLAKKEDEEKLTNALVELIQENGMRMTTGFLGTPYILHALSENGRSDIAYDLLLQEKKPSWLYSVNKGATTVWEHWDGINDEGKLWDPFMNSFNHYSYGAVFDWIFNEAAGIHILKANYEEIVIKPHVDKRLGHLDMKYLTEKGLLSVRWYFQDDAVIYEIEIPEGCNAKIILQERTYYLKGGKYMFSHVFENQNGSNLLQ